MRKFPIAVGSIQHVFNRGVNKGEIFFEDKDYKRFLAVALHYKSSNKKYSYETNLPNSDDPVSSKVKVEVLAYCLMPNHFHFLLKEIESGGISSFLRRLSNSYAHYVNLKHERSGPLFGSRFKNVPIESDELLLHVSRYIHLNPLVSGLGKSLDDYRWSSYPGYLGPDDSLVDLGLIKGYFKTKEDYKNFVLDQAEYARELDRIKHLTHDLE